MIKFKTLIILFAAATLFSSCAMVKSPVMGMWYTGVKAPLLISDNAGSSKMGTGEAISILGLIAYGDASIQTAAKAAGITKIHHVDEEATNIVGIYARYRVRVYGE